jgi:hypothetical protein
MSGVFRKYCCVHPIRDEQAFGPETRVENANGMVQFGAWAVIVLLIVVPMWLLMTPNTGNLAWVAWAVVSLWAALDAVSLAVRAFPVRHTPRLAIMITVLALANAMISFAVVIMPRALFRN